MLLALLSAIFALLKSLEFIYLYQIKEYRFDRFDLFLREVGVLKVLYATPPKLPARSLRNYLIAVLNIVFTLSLFFLYSFYPAPALIALLILSPFVGFLFTSMGVFATGLAASFKRKRIIEAARRRITKSDAVFIGITGSYGKTSTKEFLYTVLSKRFTVARTDENMNTDVGVALSILKNLHKDTQFFIAEAGAYRMGEITQICNLIHPHYAILTALGNQHVGLFGSRQNLVKAKSELLEAVPAIGVAYINRDIPEFAKIAKEVRGSVRSFSMTQKADVTAQNVHVDGAMLTATVQYKKNTFTVKTKILGAHNIQNLLPVVALASDLGMQKWEIERAVASLEAPFSTLSMKKGLKGATVLLDAYNSSVEGFLAALEVASNSIQRKKIIVSRGILELGREKQASYRKILDELERSRLHLYSTDRLFKKLDGRGRTLFFPTEKGLLTALENDASKDTLIVVEGKFSKNFIESVLKHGK